MSGHPGGGKRYAVLKFQAGNSVQPLCFSGFDNEVTCEQDVKGSVRLSNSTSIQAVQVAIATVTIEDDDGKIIASFPGFLLGTNCEYAAEFTKRPQQKARIGTRLYIHSITICLWSHSSSHEAVAINIGFESSFHVFAEDSGMQHVFVVLGTDNPSPITLQITGGKQNWLIELIINLQITRTSKQIYCCV